MADKGVLFRGMATGDSIPPLSFGTLPRFFREQLRRRDPLMFFRGQLKLRRGRRCCRGVDGVGFGWLSWGSAGQPEHHQSGGVHSVVFWITIVRNLLVKVFWITIVRWLLVKVQMKYLHELTPKSRFYSVKVTVATKNRAIQPPGKTRYQRLTLKDAKGTHMDATLYGDDIDMFKDIIQKNGEYEISNAFISRVNARFPGHCNDHQMTISSRTLLHRLDAAASSSHTDAAYIQIASIPHDPYATQQFDVVAVVLHVGPSKPISGSSGFPVNVREVVVTDDSTEDTLVVSLWSDLANNEAVTLASQVDSTPVISFTDLHASKFLGFSLASSRSTLVSFAPQGERVDALKTWKESNADMIEARQQHAVEACTVSNTPLASTIKDMLAKTPQDTVYNRNIRLHIFIPDFSRDNVTIFFGCKLCGKKSDLENNVTFVCEFCSRTSTTEPRLFFNFHGTDGSGTKMFSAYTKTAEKLLEMSVGDLLELSPEDNESFYAKLATRFRAKATCIELSPIPPAVAEMNTVKWVMKDVIT